MSYCLLFIQTGLIEKWLPTAFFSFPLASDWAKMTSLCIPVIIYITLPPFLLKFKKKNDYPTNTVLHY
jgi:hypothetical protein